MMRRRKSVMKLAILMLCHKNAEQINLFLDILKHPDIEFFIHIDWSAREGKPENSPNTLTMGDYDKMKATNYLMARKFDVLMDKEILIYLIHHL